MSGGEPEILVVGGGPAGAAAAAWLAEAGRRVVVLERSAGPHDKVCGEFVSAEAVEILRRLGRDPSGLGAVPIERTRIVAGRREASAALPFPAVSLTRRVMDEALLAAAAERGAEIRRGVAVRALEPAGGGVIARGPDVTAAFALLATGKHDLRGRRRPAPDGAEPIGFKMYWTLRPDQARALEGHVEIHLFPGGYAGLQPSPGGRANLCLVVEKAVYERLGRSWPALLEHMGGEAPLLAERLLGAEPAWAKPLAIFGIPYGFVAAGPATDPVVPVGDQLAVIPSFSGDGMAIALHSGRRAALAHIAGEDAPDGRLYRPQIARARLVSAFLARPAMASVAVVVARMAPALIKAAAHGTRVPGAVQGG